MDMAAIKGLYAVLDSSLLAANEMDAAAGEVLDGGARIVQLRAKGWGAGETLATARRLAALASERGALFIVNDRADVAAISGAGGVHLGQDDLPVREARRLFSGTKGFVIGASTHNVDEAARAEADGADYISFGPVFSTTTKKDAEDPKGVEALRKVKAAVTIPVVAIGGINEGNISGVVRAGADAVAVISDILTALDRRRKVERLSALIGY